MQFSADCGFARRSSHCSEASQDAGFCNIIGVRDLSSWISSKCCVLPCLVPEVLPFVMCEARVDGLLRT